ncbi:hypothetical protein AX16_005397 [Volvariella volvacea WC 439]|nr:hypothetical protein AX16_005397 [Volvariella volvacea WC 439]
MRVVATFHPPSSVLGSIKCSLSTPELDHLVVAKLNRIEVHSLQPHGLQLECATEILGRIHCVKAIPIPGTHRSNVLVLTGHPEPELLVFSYIEPEGATRQLVVKKQLQLFERTPRPAEFCHTILIHPSGKLALVSVYTGKLKVITFKGGNYQEDYDVSLPELNVLNITFLPAPEGDYVIGILHVDYQERLQLLARDLLLEDLELSITPSVLFQPTVLSLKTFPFPTELVPHLIPVPPSVIDEDSLGGVLVVGGKSILLYELLGFDGQEKAKGKKRRLESRKNSSDPAEVSKAKEKEKERESRRRKAKAAVPWPWGEITAWCEVTERRFILGDAYGRLALLSLEALQEQGLVLIPLGETSSPATLTHLSAQVLYVGSHVGDSKVLQITPTATTLRDRPTLPIPPEVPTASPGSLSNGKRKDKGKAPATEDVDMELQDVSKGVVVRTTGSFLQTISNYNNIAPIMDAALVDLNNDGQRQIITCSGGRNTGSVNIIRSGADFSELAEVPGLVNVTNVWPIKAHFEDETHTHLAASTLLETYLFRIENNATTNATTLVHVTDFSSRSLTLSQPTLAIANVMRRTIGASGKASYINSSMIVQVTPAGAFLLDWDVAIGEYTQIAAWNAPQNGALPVSIVAASINPSQVVVALSGGKLVSLSITEEQKFREVLSGIPSHSEISAVSCMPLDPKKPFASLIPVAYWGSNIIEVILLDRTGFVSVCKSAPLPAVVRSLTLFSFGAAEDAVQNTGNHNQSNPHLVAGLADGSIVTFAWKDKQLKDRKIVSLGHTPVALAPCMVEGNRAIFAAGYRAMMLSWDRKRLRYSPIMLKETVAAAPLNTTAFPSALLLATPMGLHIGRVKDVDKLHIRSIPFGLDNPRRIVHEPSSKTFGVACTRMEPGRIGDPELPSSSFKLLDDTTFKVLSEFHAHADEEITALKTVETMIEGKPSTLFVLGTYVYQAEEREPSQGRLLLLGANLPDLRTREHSLELSLVASLDVKGCVYAITVVDSNIIAAINSSVHMYSIVDSDDYSQQPTLTKVAEWNHNYLVASLGSFDSTVIVGDHISSVSVLNAEQTTLKHIARDYGPLWPVAVEAFDGHQFIAANDASNLTTFTLVNPRADRYALETDGKYYLGDLVTKFIRGSIVSSDQLNDNTFQPTQILFAASGRIGVIVDIQDEQVSLQLTGLQRNLGYAVETVGGTSHARYRAPKNTRGASDADAASVGFLDGDYLEQFLSLIGTQPEQVTKVISGRAVPEKLSASVEELQNVLERLQNVH